MVEKFTEGTEEGNDAVDDFNAAITILNRGNGVPRGTTAEIQAFVTAEIAAGRTVDIIAINTTRGGPEYWDETNGGRPMLGP